MQAGKLPDDRGRLQSQLAKFLTRCPYGIIHVDDLQDLHHGLVPVWINALSEQVGWALPAGRGSITCMLVRPMAA